MGKLEVSLKKLVGTNHPAYGGKVDRWIDMLTSLQRLTLK